MNVYANKTMTVTKDCLDDSFKPSSPHVEVIHGCQGGCLVSFRDSPIDLMAEGSNIPMLGMRGFRSSTGGVCFKTRTCPINQRLEASFDNQPEDF
jgi:hypothetical protein